MSEAESGQNPQVRLERVYLKRAEFDSPASPQLFIENWKPQMTVDINTSFSKIDDIRFEVVLRIKARAAKENGDTGFSLEVLQAGIFHIEGLEAAALQRVLGTICPSTVFPYARESLDSLAVKGSFPPLQLAPVNFDSLFAQALAQQQQQAADAETQH